ncbi:MAG: hypothetical protein IH624_04935 [Phycisphaerae bacterium]|nr:hypothetical protein [Phycisphaerae bacterium]
MENEETAVGTEMNAEGTPPKVYSEEQFNGLLADKQAEVRKRQELERQLAEVQAARKKDETPPPGANGGTGKSPDDARPVTVAELRMFLAEQRKADADAAFASRESESRAAAVKEYSVEACGDGLDYESVMAAGEVHLTEGDRLAIRQASDPAAERYRRCVMLTPELREKAEAVRTAKLLEKIKLTGRAPATGGGQAGMTPDDVGRMSEEELDRLAESLG